MTKYMNYLYEVDCLLFRIINGERQEKMAESILYHDYPYGRRIFYYLHFDCTDHIFYKSMEKLRQSRAEWLWPSVQYLFFS